MATEDLTPAQVAENYEPLVIGTNVLLGGLALLAVGLRVLARRITKVGLGSDDYTIIASLVCSSEETCSNDGQQS